jgi:hypothetical protein
VDRSHYDFLDTAMEETIMSNPEPPSGVSVLSRRIFRPLDSQPEPGVALRVPRGSHQFIAHRFPEK